MRFLRWLNLTFGWGVEFQDVPPAQFLADHPEIRLPANARLKNAAIIRKGLLLRLLTWGRTPATVTVTELADE